MYPDQVGWTLTNQLLASIVDVLRWLQWAKTEDGSKGRNMPEPIERPGVKARYRSAHPKGRGLPRSKLRKILKRTERPDRIKRLRELFSSDEA